MDIQFSKSHGKMFVGVFMVAAGFMITGCQNSAEKGIGEFEDVASTDAGELRASETDKSSDLFAIPDSDRDSTSTIEKPSDNPITPSIQNEMSSPVSTDQTSVSTNVLSTTGSVESAAVSSSDQPHVLRITPDKVPLHEETSITLAGQKLDGARVEFRMNKQEATFPKILTNSGNELVILRTADEAPLSGKWDIVLVFPDGSSVEMPEVLEVQ